MAVHINTVTRLPNSRIARHVVTIESMPEPQGRGGFPPLNNHAPDRPGHEGERWWMMPPVAAEQYMLETFGNVYPCDYSSSKWVSSCFACASCTPLGPCLREDMCRLSELTYMISKCSATCGSCKICPMKHAAGIPSGPRCTSKPNHLCEHPEATLTCAKSISCLDAMPVAAGPLKRRGNTGTH